MVVSYSIPFVIRLYPPCIGSIRNESLSYSLLLYVGVALVFWRVSWHPSPMPIVDYPFRHTPIQYSPLAYCWGVA
jgi:hypothetical protein